MPVVTQLVSKRNEIWVQPLGPELVIFPEN